jgi:non-specific serine/threonine protein kinase
MAQVADLLARALGRPTPGTLRDLPARSVPNNLPERMSSFVGRARELTVVEELCASNRLVTLTGPGGCGKTRLALEVARRLLETRPDGVWFVDLGAITDGDDVASAARTALGLRQRARRTATDALTARLREQRVALVLDNCEHVLDAAAAFTRTVLERCGGTTFIATSREALGLPGEAVYPVPPLSLGRTAGDLDRCDAVALFVERARAARPGFRLADDNVATIAGICRRLDGIPLAIELAAARVRGMTPDTIATRLAESLDLLARRAVEPRQQTIRAAFRWSYDLLDADERRVLQRLAVFTGGCTLEAAEAVCADARHIPRARVLDLLVALVEKSLVTFVPGAPERERYRLLETTRGYALEALLAAGDADTALERHLDHYLALVEDAARDDDPAPDGAVATLGTENDNIKAALETALLRAGDDRALRLAGAMGWFWQLRGDYHYGRTALARALENAPDGGDPARRARALRVAGELAYYQDDRAAAGPLLAESLRSYRLLGDRLGIAVTLRLQGIVASHDGDFGRSMALYEESLAICRAAGGEATRSAWRREEARALANCSFVRWHLGDYDRSLALAEEAAALAAEVGDRIGAARCSINAGRALWGSGRLPEAEGRLRDALASCRELVAPFYCAYAIAFLLQVLVDRPSGPAPDLESATLAEEMIALARREGLLHAEIHGLSLRARVHEHHGEITEAVSCSLRAVTLLEGAGALDLDKEEIWFHHYRLLELAGQRGESYLARAARELEAKAARILDPELRRKFRDNVAVHRAIGAAVAKRYMA